MYEQIGGNASFRQTFCVSFYREIALGTLRCFTKVLLAGILLEWEKGISRFSVANFLYQSFESFLWELFVVSENFSQRKYLGMRRGLSRFPVGLFRLTIPKRFIGSSSVFQGNSGSEKFVWMWGGISRFPVDFVSSHNTENFHWELFSVSRKLSHRKVCMDERRGYHVFQSKTFESQYRRI